MLVVLQLKDLFFGASLPRLVLGVVKAIQRHFRGFLKSISLVPTPFRRSIWSRLGFWSRSPSVLAVREHVASCKDRFSCASTRSLHGCRPSTQEFAHRSILVHGVL